MKNRLSLFWFILGLCSQLQIVASLSITEMIVLMAAPVMLVTGWYEMRKDGVMTCFILSILVILGCLIACIANKSPAQFALRGFAATCILSCSIIFSHWMIRRDAGGIKWFLLGTAISLIICTFVFQRAYEAGMYHQRDTAEIMSRPLYLLSRASAFIMLPTKGWYLQTPTIINIFAPLITVAIAMVSTTSGRAASLSALGFVMLVLIGGKSRRKMMRIPRNFGKIILLSVIAVLVAYGGYSYSARLGWLGEEAQKKYERQTGGEKGVMRLLLGGRAASFVGLLACRDKPIVGWGPWAIDENGYMEEFIEKYGTLDDIEQLEAARRYRILNSLPAGKIECHSYITEFWLWYGILGLLFIVYIIFVFIRYMRQDVAVIPQWYAWLACSVPSIMWDIFFSPLSSRFGFALAVVACLYARAVRRGLVRLPNEMQKEIIDSERRGG